MLALNAYGVHLDMSLGSTCVVMTVALSSHVGTVFGMERQDFSREEEEGLAGGYRMLLMGIPVI